MRKRALSIVLAGIITFSSAFGMSGISVNAEDGSTGVTSSTSGESSTDARTGTTSSEGSSTSEPSTEGTSDKKTDTSDTTSSSVTTTTETTTTGAATETTTTTGDNVEKDGYTITLDANGGAFADGKTTEDFTVAPGETLTTLPEEPTRSGYSFSEWYEDKEENTLFTLTIGYKLTGNVTVYAGWEKSYSTCAITGDVSRISWIQSLIATFGLKAEDYDLPDNYYTDITETDTYYNDILMAEATGIADAEAGTDFLPNNAADREFAISSLNELLGYILNDSSDVAINDIGDFSYSRDVESAKIAVQQGWFTLDSDNDFLPRQSITSGEASKLIAIAKDDIAKDKANLDKKSVSGFKKDVTVVPNGTDVSRQNTYDTEDNITSSVVTVKNMPANIVIKKDDLFAVYYNNIPVGYRAKDVSVSDKTYTINAERAEDNLIFEDESVSLSGSFQTDPTDIIAAKGVTLSYSDADSGKKYSSAEDIPYTIDENGNKTYDDYTLQAQTTINVADGVSITYDYQLKDDPVVTYDVSSYIPLINSNPYAIVDISFSSVYTVSCNVTEDISDSLAIPTIPLFYLDLAGIGQFEVTSDIDVNGSFKATKETDHNIHFFADKNGIRINHSENTHPIGVEAELNFKAGVEMELALKEIPFVSARLYVDAGIKTNVRSHWYNDGKTPKYCLNLSSWLYAEGGAYASADLHIPGINIPSYSKTFFKYDDSNSPIKTSSHVEDGVEVSKCSRAGNPNCPGIGFNSRGFVTKSTSRWHGVSYRGTNSYTASDGTVVSSYKYTVDSDGNATITGRNGAGSSMIISSTIDGHKVIAIGDKAFYGDTALRSVIIPDSVTAIGSFAFCSCKNLANVTLSKNLTFIDGGAFSKTAINEITIPKSLTKSYGYGNQTSAGEDIGGVFSNTNLKKVNFEDGTTQIPMYLFYRCASLEEITIPNTVTTICSNAFENCTSLVTVNLPSSLTSIGDKVFENCTSLKSIVIPDSVTAIGSFAFCSCKNLANVTLSKNLTFIDGGAFSKTAINEITIPKSLTKSYGYGNQTSAGEDIGGVFSNTNLKKVNFEDGTTQIPMYLFYRCASLEEITIPNTVTTICSNAFENCTSLVTVNLPSSLTSIGDKVFENCTSLKSIVIPDSVTAIGSFAFCSCKNLANVTLSKNLTFIDGGAFSKTAINEITIPKSLTKSYGYGNQTSAGEDIGGVFSNTNLKKVNFEDGTTQIPMYLFYRCASLEEITIPNTVTTICSNAFENCTSLVTVNLPSSLTSIGDKVFENCTSLKSIVIPDSVTDMGTGIFASCTKLKKVQLPKVRINITSYTFDGCTALTDVNIPDTLQYVRSYAFRNCSSLASITLPPTLVGIENHAFYNCDSLASVEVKSTSSASIDSSAFEDCDVLSSVRLADGVSSLGASIFNSCNVLTDVSLGTGLTSIPSNAFSNCGSLEKITIPYYVTEIKSNAFINDPKLKSVTLPRNIQSIANTLFSYPFNMTIYGISGTLAEIYAKKFGIVFVDSSVPASFVSFAQSSYDVLAGKTIKLSPSIEPSNFTDEISWKVVGTTGNVTVDSNGVVKGVKVGRQNVKILVENDNDEISAVVTINVIQPVTSISVTGTTYSMEGGTTLKLTAKAYPATAKDGSVSWNSSDESVATVDGNGLVTSLKKGSAIIKAIANDGSGVYGSRTITVTSTATVVTSIDELQSAHKYENNTNATWIYKVNGAHFLQVTFSDDTSVEDGADYIYLKDKAGNAVGDGTYTGTGLAGHTVIVTGDSIRISLKADDSGRDYGFAVTNVSVLDKLPTDYTVKFNANGGTGSMDNVSIAVGATVNLPANVFSYTGKTFDKWNTAADGTGTSYANGVKVKNLCKHVGESITLYAQWKVIPVTSIILSSKSLKMTKGDSAKLSASVAPENASDKTITWSADPANSVSIVSDGLNATITAVASVGKVAVKATAVGGASDTCKISIDKYAESVTVAPSEVTIDKGSTTTLTAAILPKDASNSSIVWNSKNPGIATVDANGKVTGIGGGTAAIVATSGDGKASSQATVIVQVAALSLSLDRTLVSINKGEEDQLVASVIPLDTTDKTVTWTTKDNNIALVDSDGKIKGMSVGETLITATTANGKSENCKVIVTSSDLEKDDKYRNDFAYPDKLWISGLECKNTYTGAKLTPEFRVYYGKTLLTLGTEYSVAYKNNTNVGTATITITGRGNYTGRVIKTFEIDPIILDDENIDIAAGIENRGRAIRPVVSVYSNGNKLVENRDYTLSYDKITTAGSTDVTVTGKGNYTGIVTKKFIVKPAGTIDIKGTVVTGLNKSYSLDEAKALANNPSSITVLLKKTDITDKCDITVENANKVGTGTLVISPKQDSGYAGEKRVTFKIRGTNIGYMTVEGAYGYTGYPNNLSVNVYEGKKNNGTLLDSDAYILSYSTGLINAGTVTVTAVGNPIAGYNGKVSAKVKINAQDISDSSNVNVSLSKAVYAKGGSKPIPVITYNGWTLREGKDYTLRYANNKAAVAKGGKREPSVTILGKGNYSGKKTIAFDIWQQDIENMSIAAKNVVANAKKKGNYYCSTPKIYDVDGKLLQLNRDYTVRYIIASTNAEVDKTDVLSAGTDVREEITGINNYVGTASIIYQITSTVNDINLVKSDKIDNIFYTGKSVMPDSIGLWKGTTRSKTYLTEGTDFIITNYYNNVNIGTASMRIEGIGDYSGTKLLTYRIVAANAGSIWSGSYNSDDGIMDGLIADSVSIDDKTLNVGEIYQITPQYPDNCDIPSTLWESSNTRVAVVDRYGNVTAKKKGTAVITVKIVGTKISDTAEITVN
jgi:uncharacterized repeat protein (TIGR02543 family)